MDKVQVVKVLALQATSFARVALYDAYRELVDLFPVTLTFNDFAIAQGLPEKDFFVGNETQLDHLIGYLREKFAVPVEVTLVINSPVNVGENRETPGFIHNVVCVNLVPGCGDLIDLVKTTGGILVYNENPGRLGKIVKFLRELT
ncbi:MAG: hypothetical protein ACP5HQ_02495 [Thermoprotei archaeon]